MRWAEPRIDHAVEQLRRCAYEPSARRRTAERGQAKVLQLLEPQRVGRLMRARIEAGLDTASPGSLEAPSLRAKSGPPRTRAAP
jgi:hypothetical protein